IALSRGNVGVVIGFAGFAFGLRMSIDQLIGPLVLGTAVELPAAVIIFAMLVGGAIWGFLGVFVAVPFAAFIRIALEIAYDQQAAELGRAGA
ncbi:MAG TPA: AI-2E family transporter, partial [Tepidisphaeraceae bacterium]|nr:AI-2E family transporter [Tepidisphaeraceae bacterium]